MMYSDFWNAKILVNLVFAFTVALPATAAVPANPGVSDKEIVIGQSAAMSGPLGDIGQDLSAGARAYFDSVNSRGGIHGRRIRLITLDDAYLVPNTVRNVKKLIEEDHVFALFSIQGTPQTAAILPLAEKDQIPIYTPFSGAEIFRTPRLPNLFNVRASYANETEKMIEHLTTVGITRISVAYQDNTFGKDGLAGVEKAMQKRSMKLLSTASIRSDATDAAQAAESIQKSQPEAVIMVTAGLPSPTFIKAFNKLQKGVQFYSTSVMATQATIVSLGSDGVGVVVATVVPFPWSQSSSLAKEYQAAMRAAGKSELSFISMEGYINAKVFCDSLQLAGRDLTRERLMAATEKINVNYGGYQISYGRDGRQGSRLVELTIIGTNGKFIK